MEDAWELWAKHYRIKLQKKADAWNLKNGKVTPEFDKLNAANTKPVGRSWLYYVTYGHVAAAYEHIKTDKWAAAFNLGSPEKGGLGIPASELYDPTKDPSEDNSPNNKQWPAKRFADQYKLGCAVVWHYKHSYKENKVEKGQYDATTGWGGFHTYRLYEFPANWLAKGKESQKHAQEQFGKKK